MPMSTIVRYDARVVCALLVVLRAIAMKARAAAVW
jgi:hypothetical protein